LVSGVSVRPAGAQRLPDDADASRVSLVRLAGVSKKFGEFVALDSVALSVQRGEILGIIGRSGAGKTTLIRLLNGLERPDGGSIEIEGTNIAGLSERELQPIRRRIGMIFQHFNLLAQKTVAQNVELPLKIAGRSGEERRRRVAELLELVGLGERAGAYPAQLSGGQKQRVGIARALAADPVLLLSDEATSALDPESTVSILKLLREINDRLHLTIVLITHEMSVIRAIADRVVVMEHGRVIETGAVSRVFSTPEAAGTRSLLGSLRPELPESIASRLRAAPGDAVVLRVDVQGAQARAPLLAELSHAFGAATLLHGGIDEVQGRPLGSLFVSLRNAGPDIVERLRLFLEHRATATEVLGYLSSDD
jgi:D-methionine transport system ATP-binding protein